LSVHNILQDCLQQIRCKLLFRFKHKIAEKSKLLRPQPDEQ